MRQNRKKWGRRMISDIVVLIKETPELANRYIRIGRDIAMKCRMSIPLQLRRMYCRHCYKKISRTRIRNKKMVYFCDSCKKHTRVPFR